EGEDAAVAGHHVVALARGRRDRVEDGPVERHLRHVAEEGGVAERQDPAPAGEDPVALAGGGGREAGHGLAPGQAAGGRLAEGGGVAPGGHGAGAGHDPVAPPRGGGFEVDGRRPGGGRGAAVGAGVAEGVDGAVGAHHPVAAADPGRADRRVTAAGGRRGGRGGGRRRRRGGGGRRVGAVGERGQALGHDGGGGVGGPLEVATDVDGRRGHLDVEHAVAVPARH